MILKHKKMCGVLVLTVITSSSLELRGGGSYKTKVSRNSILSLFYNIEFEQ